MRAFPPAWPKQPEAFTVVKQTDDLLLKEDLWLADARDFLRNGPQWPMADMSKAPRTELPRRLQSVNFLAWQKGQLTEHLRRKSEQTLVAAADLRELIVAVQRDAASIQEEEEALCQAEEELLVGRQRCARELQQLWEDLDVREKALEEAALEALDVEAGEELHQAQQLSEAVCEQAGDLQEETALLFDLHQDLETREAALHCSEVAFGCLVERELTLEGLEDLREGIAKQLSEMMALGDSAREAVLTSVGGVGWTEGDFPVSDSERGDLAPSSARLVYLSRDDTSTGRPDVRKSGARASTPEESPKDDYSLEAEEEFFYEEGEEEAEDDPDPEVELEEEEEQVELLPQRLDPLLGTVDSSPGALPSESCFIGVPADANAQASNTSVSNASASATARVPAPWVPAAYPQVNRSSFPLPSAGAYPPRVAVAPLAKFPVSYCPRPATSPGRAAYVQVVAPKR